MTRRGSANRKESVRHIGALAVWVGIFIAGPITGPVAAEDDSQRPPNIVFILIDDLGWSDPGCYGNAFHDTPNIDGLARGGMRFTEFYAASPVCSSTRVSIQSGQNPARLGLTDFIPGHWRPYEKLATPITIKQMPREIVTVAEALQSADYTTGYFGKWHLGGPQHYPEHQGYDVSMVTGGRHFAPQFRVRNHPDVNPPDGAYLAEFLTDRTLDFIEENRDEPFFVQLSHYAVHIPLEARREIIDKYRDKSGPPNRVNNPIYAAMVEHCDRSVGRVLDKLDELDLADNTVVVFSSDNGGLYKRYDGGGEPVMSNAPLRGEKGTVYEGGIRVPLIVRWPGVVEPGSTSDEPAISHDFHPAFLEIARADPPADQPVDGRSLLPLLKDANASLGRDAIYFHYPHYHHSRPAGVIRAGDWKLIEFFDEDTPELYNLADDIGESEDLAGERPEKVRELHADLVEWRHEIGAKMPLENAWYDPDRADQWWNRGTRKPVDLEAMRRHFDEQPADPTEEES